MNPWIEIRRVLYVDDDDMDLLLMQRAFAAEGRQGRLHYARDRLEAMARLERDAEHGTRSKYPLPDLVLLDISLPGAPAIDVLRWIRNQPSMATLPAIMLSFSRLSLTTMVCWGQPESPLKL